MPRIGPSTAAARSHAPSPAPPPDVSVALGDPPLSGPLPSRPARAGMSLAYWLAATPAPGARTSFASAARALDGGFGHADNVLAAAEAHLDAEGVAYAEVTTAEGFTALRISDGAHPLNKLAEGIRRGLDGFQLLYSPAKLHASGSRGVVSASARELFVSHDTIASLALDPISLHEVHHAYLNLAEERGKPHAFLGSATSFNGKPVSTAASAQGGYAWYMSFQELPAYALQVHQLGATLEAGPTLEAQLAELRDMARWGWALAERTADVAARILAGLEAHPESATYWLRTTVPAGRDPKQGVPVRWAKVEIPDLAVEIPLTAPGLPDFGAGPVSPAQWQTLGAATRAHLTHLRDASTTLALAFQSILDAPDLASTRARAREARVKQLALS